MKYSLAPLLARRDIAMLGLIHRTVLGFGPKQFKLYIFGLHHRSLLFGTYDTQNLGTLANYTME